ncbi:MAG: hypothetical protein FGM15_06610 [Chthoniobacterales bacterium]|nr:hypothetical protein [Chthoniobacterales bacterium]
MLHYVKGILNFSIFRPEPDDPEAAWKARFAGKNTVLLNIGRAGLGFSVIDPKGRVKFTDRRRGELRDLFVDVLPIVKENASDGWCAVSLDTRYMVSIETNLSRKKGSEEAIKIDARSILHGRFERGKIYAVTHNPETNSSLLLSYDADFIKKTEATLKERGLKVGRLLCGVYVLLRYALGATNTKKGTENPVSALYLATCAGSVCALLQIKDNWVEIRSRPDVFFDDLQPLVELISPFAERLPEGADVVVACDEPVPGLPEKMASVFPGQKINDLTSPGLLAELIYKS